MFLIDCTLPTMVENVALDEALLLDAEQQSEPIEFLRIWEPQQLAVVMGRSGQVNKETLPDACKNDHIPVIRRSSGGGTILAGPGCLMYALILNHEIHPDSQEIQSCHDFVLNQMIQILKTLHLDCQVLGTSDLVTENRKISGNSLRRKQNETLYHGTFLCHFDLPLMTQYLTVPDRIPEYRKTREHLEFVKNMNCEMGHLKQALIEHWTPRSEFHRIPQSILNHLLETKYQDPHWHDG